MQVRGISKWSLLIAVWLLCSPCASQTCNPNDLPGELVWTNTGGEFYGALTFDVQTIPATRTPSEFTTRLLNGDFPGPTIRMVRGKTYHLTVTNNMPAEHPNNPTGSNVIKDLNTLNLHTHGLHISGMPPADDPFTEIPPEMSQYTYTYKIPCDHSGGTHWYHAHHKGSTMIQVGGGAAGMLIIEDDAVAEGLPTWFTDLIEVPFFIQTFDLALINSKGKNIDNVFVYPGGGGPSTHFSTVNGHIQPTFCMDSDKWYRFRIGHVNVEITDAIALTEGGVASPCSIKLLARDGVLVHGANNEVPRDMNPALLIPLFIGGRVDLALNCPGPGGTGVRTFTFSNSEGELATLEVKDGPGTPIVPTTFNPIRPEYLTDLRSVSNPATWTVTVSKDKINGIPFQDQNTYQRTIPLDSVQEWSLQGLTTHTFHMHLNHQQLVAGTLIGGPGFTELGDFLDVTYGTNDQVIRFRSWNFGGRMLIHCHVLEHNDKGSSALVKITNGCNAACGFFEGNGPCPTDCCPAPPAPTTPPPPTPEPTPPPPTPEPTPAPPTPQPVPLPTTSCTDPPTCSNNGQCCSNDCGPGPPPKHCQAPLKIGGVSTANSSTPLERSCKHGCIVTLVVLVCLFGVIAIGTVGYLLYQARKRHFEGMAGDILPKLSDANSAEVEMGPDKAEETRETLVSLS